MKWVGLTGSLASGKSSVGLLLKQKGYAVLDADQVVHGLLGKGGEAVPPVVRLFGANLKGPDGAIDRARLGQIVFKDAGRLRQLEDVLHPLVRAKVASWRRDCESKGLKIAFYEVPLLFEKKMQEQFDSIWVVDAPLQVRETRASKRSGWSSEEFFRREATQVRPEDKRAGASVVLENIKSLDELSVQIDKALVELC